MIIHFVINHPLVDKTIEIFEASFKGKNQFYALNSIGIKGSNHRIKNISGSNVEEAIVLNKDAKYIIIHFLDTELCRILNAIDLNHIKIGWGFWGADFFSKHKSISSLYLDDLNFKYFLKYGTFNSERNAISNFFKRIKYRFWGNHIYEKEVRIKKEFAGKINFLLHFNPLDAELINQVFRSNIEYKFFFYYDINYSDLAISQPDAVKIGKSSIGFSDHKVLFLGNSASLSNNHLSILNSLSIFDKEKFLIVSPLSYGDFNYANCVISHANKLFGSSFIPIKEYLSKEKYSNYLSSADVIIMNHIRSEAAGNVFMLLAMGKKIFLHGESNLYKFLIDNHVHVCDATKIRNLSYETFIQPLTDTEKNSNREFIISKFARENIINSLKLALN